MDAALTRIPLFRTLPTTEFKVLATACELRRFRKGETIFHEGRPAGRGGVGRDAGLGVSGEEHAARWACHHFYDDPLGAIMWDFGL